MSANDDTQRELTDGELYAAVFPEQTIGANVKRLRRARGMSQTALADAMAAEGHSSWRQTTVSRTELGTRALHMDEGEALEHILGRGLWRGTRFSASADGRTGDELRDAIDAKLDALGKELDELRELVGLYDQKRRPEEQERD